MLEITQRVYGPTRIIEDADPDTFELLDGPYALDIANAYYDQEVIKADAGSFESINDHYARDEKTGLLRWKNESKR